MNAAPCDAHLVVKTCGCGRSFIESEWRRLPRVGFQTVVSGQDPDHLEAGELRNCPCGSTLVVRLGEDGLALVSRVARGRERDYPIVERRVITSAASVAIELLEEQASAFRRRLLALTEPVTSVPPSAREASPWIGELSRLRRELLEAEGRG